MCHAYVYRVVCVCMIACTHLRVNNRTIVMTKQMIEMERPILDTI